MILLDKDMRLCKNVSIKEGEWHTGQVKTAKRSTCVDKIHFEVEM